MTNKAYPGWWTLSWLSPLLALALVDCVGTPPDKVETRQTDTASRAIGIMPLDSGLVFTVQVDSSGGRYRVVGVTNLPDSTVIMTGMQHRHRRDLVYGDRTTVSGSRFSSKPFGPASGLALGEYVADATMPYSSLQIPAVRVQLERELGGKQNRMVEHRPPGYTVSDSVIFRIGGPAGVAMGARRAQADSLAARRLAAALRELVDRGEAMEVLRSRTQLERLRVCGAEMRANQAKVDSLHRLIDSLPLPTRLPVSIAASEIRRCVSCVPTALASCREARGSLAGVN